MTIKTINNEKTVQVGSSAVFYSLYSTVKVLLKRYEKQISLGEAFLQTGKCSHINALETARQINLIRDQLSRYSPDKAVWNMLDKSLTPPWKDNLSPVITSCANLYTTADGKDLLFELVAILTYSAYNKVDIESF